jgi:hypothetical protein
MDVLEGPESRRIWLRAFYGFNPEDAGYIGFTHEAVREDMLEKMQEGDLVLIYGAVENLTQPDLRSQALGFLEVSLERCVDQERMSESSIAWKKDQGFLDRWNYGLLVRRAWRVRNRVSVKTIAPDAYQGKFRFERTTRAILLNPDECHRALSHPVRQVNVFGEPVIPDSQRSADTLERVLKPSRGIPPSFGGRAANYDDGENQLYLMILSENAEVLMGTSGNHVGHALVKVGRSNDPKRRLKEINAGFPDTARVQWLLSHRQAFENGEIAHRFENELKAIFDKLFQSQNGEFFTGERKAIVCEFQDFCIANMPKIKGAKAKARGI